MKKLIQTRLVTTHKSGNCFQTAIACILDLPIDEVPDFSTLYWKEAELANLKKRYNPEAETSEWAKDTYQHRIALWNLVYETFIASQGYRIVRLYDGKDVLPEYSYRDWLQVNQDKFYLASGDSLRGVSHIVIYQNDKLYHDPHPSQTGLVEGTIYEYKYFEKL
jgi:hypothetical protein